MWDVAETLRISAVSHFEASMDALARGHHRIAELAGRTAPGGD